jgi:FixJ family two-component response regulator
VSATATVYLVDDDPAVVTALSRVLRSEGWTVETFDSAEAFLERDGPIAEGCLVLDVTMPGVDGLELQRRLGDTDRRLPIVFVSGHGDVPMSVRAMRAGAVDFLIKPVPAATLVAAVHSGVQQAARTSRARAETAELEQRFASLTRREREVLAGLAAGKLNKQIAHDLGVVEQTVKFHRAHVMERMHAKTVAELMHIAARLGIHAMPEIPPLPSTIQSATSPPPYRKTPGH